MTRKLYFTILSLLFFSALYAQYVPDVLGGDYLRRTIQMPDDYEGKVVCTLVKKPQLPDTKQAVLYIHGYNDYFFQKQLGDSVNAHGYNFYAMDLRKYGRSILPNQDPFFCKSRISPQVNMVFPLPLDGAAIINRGLLFIVIPSFSNLRSFLS